MDQRACRSRTGALRCIEVNGHWDLFEAFLHDRMRTQGVRDRASPRLQNNIAAPLPTAAA